MYRVVALAVVLALVVLGCAASARNARHVEVAGVQGGTASGHVDSLGGAMHLPGGANPLVACTGCHGEGLKGGAGPACLSCHDAADHTRSYGGTKHRFGLRGGCTACHGPENRGGLGPACSTCHRR